MTHWNIYEFTKPLSIIVDVVQSTVSGRSLPGIFAPLVVCPLRTGINLSITHAYYTLT